MKTIIPVKTVMDLVRLMGLHESLLDEETLRLRTQADFFDGDCEIIILDENVLTAYLSPSRKNVKVSTLELGDLVEYEGKICGINHLHPDKGTATISTKPGWTGYVTLPADMVIPRLYTDLPDVEAETDPTSQQFESLAVDMSTHYQPYPENKG